MFDSSGPLAVHSLTEAMLYLMLVPCRACSGALLPRLELNNAAASAEVLVVPVACRTCGLEDRLRFDLRRVDPGEASGGWAAWAGMAESGSAPAISGADEPSRVIDVAGWLTLYARLTDAASAKSDQAASAVDRVMVRQLQIHAGQCIEEALKFYDADNDLPPEDAFFTEAGRRQFRERPDLFLRGRLVSLRVASPIARDAGGGDPA
ncbi:MAG: hypothetical protein HY718_01700 [Planctomycetes bacterium]|nr:hypothetical protein [Planctomycetota bacterium]